MLSLVATPIGNLGDITYRAVETLKTSNYILCEDTRHSKILMMKYEITTPCKSYHQFNESKMEDSVISDLKNGKNVSLITDAGTPGISDPGSRLVARCISENIDVTSIPGPCACIAALTSSGLDTTIFQFVGFLPKKELALKKAMSDILIYNGTTIAYESPNRLIKLLEVIATLDSERILVVGRELTKKFETFYRGTPEVVLEQLKKKPVKGEIVILISSNPNFALCQWSELTPEAHIDLLQETYNTTRIEAVKIVAQLRGLSKRELYKKS
ncbi:MAG: 16S rRNA (cytidine(1402)-2'-O)-methyltransferase [Chlamydiota bacterium]|nr:16S rRNA (cytidine(1402)-2'-O)-methyltransferase [Chlamydiota bacterium]